MKYKQIWKTAASCLVAALMFPSCSDDEGGGGDVQDDRYRTLMITLNSLGSPEMGTRAETVTPDEPDDFDEHFISRYWLLVLKQKVAEDETTSFVVDRVIDSEDPEYIIPDNTNPNSETEIGVEVEIGQTYRFYALANLDGLEKGDEIIDKLNKLQPGDPFDPTEYNATVKEMSKYPHGTEGQSYIPMTSYGYDQKIEPTTTELKEPIALIRLIGKITVKITNLTGEPYTVNSLTMNDMRKGEIFLFPYDVNKYDNGEPVRCLFLKEMIEKYRPSFPTTGALDDLPFTIADADKEIPSGTTEKEIAVQYVPETSWQDNADLEITADISSRGEQPKPIFTSFIRRNDWLTIPLQISPFDAAFTFSQEHMPIGGLPEKITLKANEAVIPIIDRTTDHAGKITVDFTVSVAGSSSVITDPVLVTQRQVVEGVNYSTLEVKDNDSKVLLEDRNKLNIDGTSMSGSLELTLQEMSKASTAEVEVLFVVASKSAIANGQGGKLGPYDTSIAVPYTIRLTYDNPKN